MTGNSFGAESAEEQSLVGPAHAATEQSGQVGLAQLTPEEHEKIEKALSAKDKVGLYHHEDLQIQPDGRKLIISNHPNVAIDAQTGVEVLKNHSGTWLAPTDTGYDETRKAVAVQDIKTHSPEEEKKEQDLISKIQMMVAIDKGDPEKSHDLVDAVALQRARGASSTMELKNIKNLLATVDGFAAHTDGEAVSINPEKLGKMHPPTLSGAGVEAARAAAERKKQERNEQFTAMLRKKQQDGKA